MLEYLKMAGKVALPMSASDHIRNFWLGAVGIRNDGAIVSSRNGAIHISTKMENYQLLPESHAEGRVLRKLGKNGTIYVSRIYKTNRNFAMAMPCGMCQIRCKSYGVDRVFYTINDEQYGMWDVKKGVHRVFSA